jgi:hypothetical protein
MDLQEILKERENFEKDLKVMVHDFQSKTGVRIDYTRIRNTHETKLIDWNFLVVKVILENPFPEIKN